jgi:hypothetical protein
LKTSLRAALELELSTLPPYLCGLWSIKDDAAPACALIDSIALEEMLHMGLACDMLTTIGGAPQIVDGYKEIAYPGPLPSGVRPELTVYLAGLSKQYIREVYLQIEYPERGPIAMALGQTFPTIGAFYDEILAVFLRINPPISGGKQVTTDFPGGNQLFAIQSLDDVQRAIGQIKEQGEGTSQSPVVPGSMDQEFAHYYKFAEIFHEHKLVRAGKDERGNDKWDYVGASIPFPSTYPITRIVKDGYEAPPADAKQAQHNFNQQFATVLADLQVAWAGGEGLDAAIDAMFSLKDLSRKIMSFELPGGKGVYGPQCKLA